MEQFGKLLIIVERMVDTLDKMQRYAMALEDRIESLEKQVQSLQQNNQAER